MPVAQWLEHCVSSTKVVGSIPREHILTCKCKTNAILFNFLFKESRKKYHGSHKHIKQHNCLTSVTIIDNNKCSWAANQHIRKFSEGVMIADNSAHKNTLHFTICDPGPQNIKSHKRPVFFLLRFIHHLKAAYISFPLITLLGLDNIWLRYNYLKIWNLRMQKNLNIEKITFKVVQMKFLAMHITYQKFSFYIFTVGNGGGGGGVVVSRFMILSRFFVM